MLAFTPAIEHAIRWFEATHELDVSGGVPRVRRTMVPGAGSIGEQDALLMQALDVLRDVHDDILRGRVKTTKS